jgi:glycosyltransferase involved in cell wall biosynthesis
VSDSSQQALTSIVLTFDEEVNLAACLASLRPVVGDLIVVDSGSTDRTLEIARDYGARVLSHPFTSHADQWRWALAQVPAERDWVLALDADQRLSAELQAELNGLLSSNDLGSLDGIYLKRRQIFRGAWIRHGGYYPKYLLKLFRLGRVHLDERDLMDHHFYVRGPVRKLVGDIIEDNRKEADLGFWLRKHIRYAELHAREELLRGADGGTWLLRPALFGTPDQRTIWFKQRWFRMPLFVRPFLYFVYRYVVLRGFLDGKEGFIFHFLQSFWYRLLVDIRLDELRANQRAMATSVDSRSATELSAASGGPPRRKTENGQIS